ncbi:post-transcriptional regulator [Brevibacillus humidisoli]|uniref:post-transcriptional regulator n=1 Tax=Brevibacillus humidisoli TaxID=2895522 RepID=UPI001E4EC4D9|nr:post-transcriptional regulator [Brevibacillus humidisoli]UFJ39010.1 post-transcriptional regulator [Brevibacillus humidisoli]
MTESRGLSQQDIFLEMHELCESKADEFALLGYDNISAEDVWKCVSSQYQEIPPVHKVVNDILSLKVTKYMNWLMVNMYKNPDSI